MKASELVKDKWYIINNFGYNIRAKLIESAKQGRGYRISFLWMCEEQTQVSLMKWAVFMLMT